MSLLVTNMHANMTRSHLEDAFIQTHLLMGSNYKAKIIILCHTTPLLQRTHNLFY